MHIKEYGGDEEKDDGPRGGDDKADGHVKVVQRVPAAVEHVPHRLQRLRLAEEVGDEDEGRGHRVHRPYHT